MGKGGQGETNGVLVQRQKKEFSWDDIKEKTKPDDKWLVIEGEVYNITQWSKRHPGGPRVISHYAGQDATDVFRAFHNDLSFVKKYLKPIHIGSVKDEQKIVKPIDEDFRELRATAEKMDLFKTSVTFFTIQMLHILFLDWASWAIMYYYGNGWIPFLLSIIMMTTVQSQAGYLSHDFGHLSVFRNNRKLDHFFHYFIMGIIKGASPAWWNHMHFQHHAKPNVIDVDPDVRLETLFVFGENMPVEVAKRKKKSMPYNWQNYYFFLIGPPLLFPIYFHIMVFRHIFTRRAWMDLLMSVIYFTSFFYLYTPILGLGWTVIYYIAFRCLESHWFTWVSQSNHIPMKIDHDKALPWLRLQLQATCNVEQSFFNDWFTGHLNFQIEHHLFPTMPRHNLYKIAPFVKSLCKEHDVPYQVKPLQTAFADIIRSLKHSGELWELTYQTYHLNSHPDH